MLFLHGVVSCDATRGSVFAVETVLQVEFGLSNQVIGSHQIPVINGDGERGIHRERGLHVKGSNTKTYICCLRWDEMSLCAQTPSHTTHMYTLIQLEWNSVINKVSLHVKGTVRGLSLLRRALMDELVLPKCLSLVCSVGLMRRRSL